MNTTFSTIVAGTIIYVIGEYLQRFYFEPIKKYKGVIGEIDSKLYIFQNILVTSLPKEAESYDGRITGILAGENTMRTNYDLQRECRREMRQLGGNLKASWNELPGIYKKFKRIEINELIKQFTFLYNNVGDGKNASAIAKIRENLEI